VPLQIFAYRSAQLAQVDMDRPPGIEYSPEQVYGTTVG
jgi:hypothetical protein